MASISDCESLLSLPFDEPSDGACGSAPTDASRTS
jgi:hypothetical protein